MQLAAEEMTEEENRSICKRLMHIVEEFERAMDDDFNTADAIAAIFELVKFANTTADSRKLKGISPGITGQNRKTLVMFLD